MAFESAADRLAFLQSCGGQQVTVGGSTIWAIFDEAFEGVGIGGPIVESSAPSLYVRTEDVPAVAHGVAVTVDAESFVVRGIQPDGTGMTILTLEEV